MNAHAQASSLYPLTAAEWLARWDAGELVHTIEMGGLGPGYEQCIHVTAAEILRYWLAEKVDHTTWSEQEKWDETRKATSKAVCAIPAIDDLGLSGAQWGAAVSIASALYMRGPCEVMADPAVKSRHIMVSNKFPGTVH